MNSFLKKISLTHWLGNQTGCSSKNKESGCNCHHEETHQDQEGIDRRKAISTFAKSAALAATAVGAGSMPVFAAKTDQPRLEFEEFIKKNYRLMDPTERFETIQRMERLAEINYGTKPKISTADARPNVLFGYAFNISKCEGYMECVQACKKENNQDRESDMEYIRIFEIENGSLGLDSANGHYHHEVPVEGSFYMGTQCFHCENPPCTKVCPVGATWKEADGIVVVDYDWCIGCRYCEAACPYFGRRFNWSEPKIPQEEINLNQHYLGNRPRKKGVMEKCTFCIQRSREGKNPACVSACPTGARIFGNLLDPQSDIRYVLENKKVFRLKEDLGTEPKFWYFMD